VYTCEIHIIQLINTHNLLHKHSYVPCKPGMIQVAVHSNMAWNKHSASI